MRFLSFDQFVQFWYVGKLGSRAHGGNYPEVKGDRQQGYTGGHGGKLLRCYRRLFCAGRGFWRGEDDLSAPSVSIQRGIKIRVPPTLHEKSSREIIGESGSFAKPGNG